MQERFCTLLSASNNNDANATRRKYTRRDCDECVSVINGKTYPVENWSLGGLQIKADERIFGMNDTVGVVLKFKLSQKILDIPHTAHVVRKGKSKIALAFTPLPHAIRNHFQNVIDDYVASQFAASQSGL